MRHAQVGIVVFALQIHEDRGQHAAAAAGGCGDDGAVGGVLLRRGEGVGADELQLAHLRDLLRVLAFVEIFGLALHVKPAGQDAGRLQSLLDLAAHGAPDLLQKVPDLRALVQLDVLAQRDIAPAAVLRDLREGVFRVDLLRAGRFAALDDDIAAADGLHAHRRDLFFALVGGKIERVRVLEIVGVLVGEDDLRRGGGQDLAQHAVGAVADAGQGQRAVERDFIALRVGMLLLEDAGRALRPHGVGAGRALADFIKITNGFHDMCLRYRNVSA